MPPILPTFFPMTPVVVTALPATSVSVNCAVPAKSIRPPYSPEAELSLIVQPWSVVVPPLLSPAPFWDELPLIVHSLRPAGPVRYSPPPSRPAELPLTVQSWTIAGETECPLKRPPPLFPAELPLIVHPSTVIVPRL